MVKWWIEKELFLTQIGLESEIQMAYYDWIQIKKSITHFTTGNEYNDFKEYLEENTKIVTVDNNDFDEVFNNFIKDLELSENKVRDSID